MKNFSPLSFSYETYFHLLYIPYLSSTNASIYIIQTLWKLFTLMSAQHEFEFRANSLGNNFSLSRVYTQLLMCIHYLRKAKLHTLTHMFNVQSHPVFHARVDRRRWRAALYDRNSCDECSVPVKYLKDPKKQTFKIEEVWQCYIAATLACEYFKGKNSVGGKALLFFFLFLSLS